ncbi:Formate hydrogenlyase subunit 4 [hydrothermal vent metagenome]|uniref:Formate hydrogenlyase subunit 4 n=1 Tax=hydrothermal vent metagenome TaxID=652676 RepID=A0A1W1BEN7_9ZZZZ
MILYFITIILLVLIAPLLLSYIKATKMLLLFKRPISIFQGYRDFSKLMHKETIISEETSAITTYAPFLVLSPLQGLFHSLLFFLCFWGLIVPVHLGEWEVLVRHLSRHLLSLLWCLQSFQSL